MPYKSVVERRARHQRWKKTPAGRDADRRYRRKLKTECLTHYGGKCACCGEDRHEFLAIDHEHGGGRQHRLQLKIAGGWNFYAWLKKQGYPPGYRVLCHNCNVAYGIFGYCPHQKKQHIDWF